MSRLATLACALALVGCSKDGGTGPGGNGSTATLAGSLAASDGRTGSITLTAQVPSPSPSVAAGAGASLVAAVINLTGTVSLSDGTTAALTGTWDNVTGALSASGGGFSFSGTLLNGSLSGGFTGPSITGVFSLRLGSSAGDVAVYCGTYTGRELEDDPLGATGYGPDNGTWNLVVGSSGVDVIVLSDEGTPLALAGTRSGRSLSITVPGGSATGTITGAGDEFVKGTYTVAGGGYGTFKGSRAFCTATSQSAPVASITVNHPGIGTSGPLGRLLYDSTLVYATAWDAAGNIVAAPLLTWGTSGPARSNGAITPAGQKWFVPDTAGWNPQAVQPVMSSSVTVTSQTNPGATATAVLMIHVN